MSRDRLAVLLLERVRAEPGMWQLYGALLAEADRVLDELGVDKRSQRLMEELDQHSRLRLERYPRWHRLTRRLRSLRSGRGRSRDRDQVSE